MNRRHLLTAGVGLATLGASNLLGAHRLLAADAGTGPGGNLPSRDPNAAPPNSLVQTPSGVSSDSQSQADTYSHDEIIEAASNFLGITAEAIGAALERIFAQNGRPSAYIAGEEMAAAITIGLRYGKGFLYMKNIDHSTRVFWQGPSVGFDFRANASRVFTLCYGLNYPDAIYRRFPGVEGSAYFIGGLGVNYQKGDGITLAPVRAGVGLGTGANIGYLSYSRHRSWLPF